MTLYERFKKPLRIIFTFILAAAAATVLVNQWYFSRSSEPGGEELDRLGLVPHFSLKEARGATVGLGDLEGKVWVVDFFFTHCAGACPAMSERMAALQGQLFDEFSEARLLESARFVSISVDPDRDTPEVLTEYAQEYGAREGFWLFLRGEWSAIQKLASQGFHLGMEASGSEIEPIIHSQKFVLVDRETQIRGYYDSVDKEDRDRLYKQLIAMIRSEQP